MLPGTFLLFGVSVNTNTFCCSLGGSFFEACQNITSWIGSCTICHSVTQLYCFCKRCETQRTVTMKSCLPCALPHPSMLTISHVTYDLYMTVSKFENLPFLSYCTACCKAVLSCVCLGLWLTVFSCFRVVAVGLFCVEKMLHSVCVFCISRKSTFFFI
jgi:hypothetical protein